MDSGTLSLSSAGKDKATKDSQIRTLKEEISHQEELISKLQKEKRAVGDSRQKTEEDTQAMEDKCNHLNKVKAKLEQVLYPCIIIMKTVFMIQTCIFNRFNI